jgi:hypothetical protein
MCDKKKRNMSLESNNLFTPILFTLKWDKFPCVQGKRQIHFLQKLGDTIIFPTNMDSKTAPLPSVSNKMFGA